MAVDVESLYRRYGPLVLRRCKKMLGDEQRAAEAMHDTFVQILRRRETLEDRGLGGLLYQTATRVCLNRMRSARRRPADPASDELARIADEVRAADRLQARALLSRVLDSQPDTTTDIAMLHLHDGLTLEQTARIVGLSVSGVRDRLRRLRSTLKELAVD